MKRIRGLVTDSITSQSLENATVSLYRLPDSLLVERTRNAKNGFYIRNQSGRFLLISSYTGYKDDTLALVIRMSDSLVVLREIKLQKAVTELKEVIVQTVVPPVIVKNDTIIYDAGSFKTRPNAVVEELLKRLPGLQVDANGNITMQGQKIEKIYVDGKEFFLNDPKLATRNLKADMIDKVEVFDEKSEVSRQTGITDPNAGKSLNLRLKPDKKRGYMAKVYGGYGTQDRYVGGATFMRMHEKNKLLAQGSSMNAGGLFSPTGSGISGRISPGDSRNHYGSVDFGTEINKKWSVVSSAQITSNTSLNETINKRHTFLEDSSLLQDKQQLVNNRSDNGQLTFNISYKPDSQTTLRVGGNLEKSSGNNRSMDYFSSKVIKDVTYLLNEGNMSNNTKNNELNSAFNISFGRRLNKKGRYVNIIVSYQHSQSDENISLYSFTTYGTDTLIRDQRTNQEKNGNTYAVRLTYAEPVGKGQFIDFVYSLVGSKGASDRFTYNYNPATKEYDDPDSAATAIFRNDNLTQQWSAGYNFQRSKFRYQLGLGIQYADQNNNLVKQQVLNFFPRANIIFSPMRGKSLRIFYSGRSLQPTTEQLQPVADYSNPLFIKVGNPGLKQQFAHNLRMNWTASKSRSKRVLMIQADFNKVINEIVPAISIDQQGIQRQQFVNVNGNYSLNTRLSASFSFIRSETSLRYSENINMVNGRRNKRNVSGWSQALISDFSIKEKMFAGLTASVSGSRTSSTLQKPATVFNQSHIAYITYVLPMEFTLSSSLNWQVNGSQADLPGQSIAVWNASLSKFMLPKKTGEIRLSAFDLLNKNKAFTQSISDNFIETNQSMVLQRFFLLSFIYQFDRFGKGKSKHEALK